MPKRVSEATLFLRDLARRFPNATSRGLARKAYSQHPAMWSNEEDCRRTIRTIRGKNGKLMREMIADKTQYEKSARPVVAFPGIPKPLRYIDEREPFVIDTPGRWLVLSDIHLPYHDAEAIRAVWKYALGLGVVGVLLNGDTQDFHAISKWETDPRDRDLANEIDVGIQFRRALREAFGKKCRIVEKFGNHDERLELYLIRKAPELLDLEQMQYEKLLGLEHVGIEPVKDKRVIKLGKLPVIHGHELRGGASSPIGPARWLFMKVNSSAMCGHYHQSSTFSKSGLADHPITCWSTGCLCDKKPKYAPINEWVTGAAMVEVGKDLSFSVNNFRVMDGQVWS